MGDPNKILTSGNAYLAVTNLAGSASTQQLQGLPLGTPNDSATGPVAVKTLPVGGLADAVAGDYEAVAASQTDQPLGATGATGDYFAGLLIVPATTSPGAVSIKDGGGSAITVFTGGASSVSNLVPFFIPLGSKSIAGAWKVTTGSNVSAFAVGNFT